MIGYQMNKFVSTFASLGDHWLPNNIEIPDITVDGWTANGQIKWLEHKFPDDVKKLLCDVNECDVYYESESSGDEDDNGITYDIL